MDNVNNISFGKAISVKYNKKLKQETLIVTNNTDTVAIPLTEIDIEREWTSLSGFIKRELRYIVIDEVDGIKIASRKRVQELLREDTLSRLVAGETFDARVINMLKYGAYLEINGVLTVLLKNADFSDKLITVKEVLTKGDTLKVRIKKSSKNDKVLVESINKYIPDTDQFFNYLKEDTIIPGTIKTLRPDVCFVNLFPGVDALANIPLHLEVDEGVRVELEVKRIDRENKKIRGKVISIKY